MYSFYIEQLLLGLIITPQVDHHSRTHGKNKCYIDTSAIRMQVHEAQNACSCRTAIVWKGTHTVNRKHY